MVLIIFGMLGLSFAAVPLYKIFCQATGFGGTPKIALKLPDRIEEKRSIRIHFNSDVSKKLPWVFTPLQKEIQVKAGELGLAFYRVQNTCDQPIKGIATYNVTPDKAGEYFNKIACFCFEEQCIMPHEVIDMPVQFFIDPDIINDSNLKDVQVITLSYTFFPVEDFYSTELGDLSTHSKRSLSRKRRFFKKPHSRL